MWNQPLGEARYAAFNGDKENFKKFQKFLLTADFIYVRKIENRRKENERASVSESEF
jgi:hypothetical protein